MTRTYTQAEIEQVVGELPAEPESSGAFAVPEEVPQGERHQTMFKLVRSQKARGISLEAALACCHEENRRKNNPPIDEVELEGYLRRSWEQADREQPPKFVQNKSKNGVAASNQKNVRLALQDLGCTVRFDAFAQKTLMTMNGGPLQPFDDRTAIPAWLRIEQKHHFRPPRELFDAVVKDMGWNNTYHPVRDYLDGLTWDGRKRLDGWLENYAGAETNDYVRAVSALVLMAAVRRVRSPGCKFDELLILESPQGWNKSSALRTLCPNPDWFSDDLPLGVDGKQVIERTLGKLLIEASDLHGNRKREAEQVKSFLSRQVDGPVRLAYARLPVEVPRQFVVIGTTNESGGYLNDTTGGRRFWPVRVQRFDLRMLRRDRDQLWAEAAVREAEKGASIRLDPKLYGVAAKQQEDRRLVDEWEDLIRERVEGMDEKKIADRPQWVTTREVWHAIDVLGNARDNRHAARVRAIMQHLGYPIKRVMRLNTKPTRCWLREDQLFLDEEVDIETEVDESDKAGDCDLP
jgi:predicted P-loop ATPase